MKPEINRKQFAATRPIPPFGDLIKWVCYILQLLDPNTYTMEELDGESRRRLNNAISILGNHTVYNLTLGELVREDTKQALFLNSLREQCPALASVENRPPPPFYRKSLKEWLDSSCYKASSALLDQPACHAEQSTF